jgi:hypothetical protein
MEPSNSREREGSLLHLRRAIQRFELSFLHSTMSTHLWYEIIAGLYGVLSEIMVAMGLSRIITLSAKTNPINLFPWQPLLRFKFKYYL